MAGGFAHITLVDILCKDGDALDSIKNLLPSMKRALAFNLNYVELGAVSPDYPYLCLFDDDAAGWANVMHYWKTLEPIRRAIPLVSDMDFRSGAAARCLAWLFGYTAHVVTDLTIHPVVLLKVGPYEKNKCPHRVCEMNQDVYIFNEANHVEITRAEYIKEGGIASCNDSDDRRRLDPDVTRLWKQCLPSVSGTAFGFEPSLKVPTAPPDPNKWHRLYVRMVDNIAEEGCRLPPLTRHFGQDAGLIYPSLADLDRSFIDALPSPEGQISYDAVFERTKKTVAMAWDQLGRALDKGDSSFLTIPDGNLDTGRDEAGNLIFWKDAV